MHFSVVVDGDVLRIALVCKKLRNLHKHPECDQEFLINVAAFFL